MCEHTEISSIINDLSKIPDTREAKKVWHLLYEILFIIICAVICGADSPGGVRRFAISKYDWLKRILSLNAGIPSRDTFGRVLANLDTEALKVVLRKWLLSFENILGQQIAIDGKAVRHSYDKAIGSKAIHLVNAFAVDAKLFLGHEKVADKSNEITAIPKLLEILDIKGKVVSLDAMGCQKTIAKQIIFQEGDYLFALKGNQGELYNDVKLIFNSPVDEIKVYKSKATEKTRGKVVIRECYVINDVSWLNCVGDWVGLSGIVKSTRTVMSEKKVTTSDRYFITSLKTTAKQIGKFIRGHWAVENSLHWVLDMSFSEDASRLRKDNSSENLSMIKKITMNLIKIANNKREKKTSIKGCRECAGWNERFLEEIIFGQKLPQTPLYIRGMLDKPVHHA